MNKAVPETDMAANKKAGAAPQDNPKTQGADADNRIKDPKDWVTGDEPMTGAQASYLKTLSEQKHDPEAFEADLTKGEASERIEALKERKPG